MAVKRFKPTTSTLRGTRLLDTKHLDSTSDIPKKLLKTKKKRAGRNNQGRVTVRHQGGGYKRKIRVIDMKRDKFDIPAKVTGLYFDPNRTAHLAMLTYADGEKRLILALKGMKVGDTVIAGEDVDVVRGNAMKLKNIPSGTEVCCVENIPGQGAKYARSAGASVSVQGIDPSGKYVQIKMPSSEIRLVHKECMATIGKICNEEKMNVKLGKAGRKRNLGVRPTVRGMAMHAVQHPHGGGEGKGVVGRAKDIWGHRIGTRTRKNKRTDKFIIKSRKVKRRPDRSK